EYLELGCEAVQHGFGRVGVLPFLILPLAGLQCTLKIHLRALLQILLDDLAETLVEDHHPVPLGLLTPLASRLVAPRLAGGNAQIGDRPAILGTTDLRIRAQIADEDHLVDRTRHVSLSCCDAPTALATKKHGKRDAAYVMPLPMCGHPSLKPHPQATPGRARVAPCSHKS